MKWIVSSKGGMINMRKIRSIRYEHNKLKIRMGKSSKEIYTESIKMNKSLYIKVREVICAFSEGELIGHTIDLWEVITDMMNEGEI